MYRKDVQGNVTAIINDNGLVVASYVYDAMKRLDIRDKDLMQRLHRAKNKYPYQNKLKGLLKVLEEILGKWGKL